MSERQQTPGQMLSVFMRRRGWSSARLAEVAREVSGSSVRAYLADRTVPRAPQALAIANALGPRDGRALLDAWGFTDLADGFTDTWRRTMTGDDAAIQSVADVYYRYNKIEYLGEPLSEAGLAVAQAVLAWLQEVEVTRRTEPPA